MTTDTFPTPAGTADLLAAVTYWADLTAHAATERDRAIVAAVATGHSQRAVARAAGLSHPAIAKVIARTPA